MKARIGAADSHDSPRIVLNFGQIVELGDGNCDHSGQTAVVQTFFCEIFWEIQQKI